MVFLNKIGSWSYELKNIFPTYRKPGSSLYNLEKIEEKRFWKKKKKFYIENGNAVYIPWSMSWASYRKYMEKVLRMFVLKNLYKKTNLLYKCPSLRGSKPNSYDIFSLDVVLIAPVIARQALYSIDSNLSQKELLKAWSYKISP